MLFVLVAASLGSITPESRPSARLLAVNEAPAYFEPTARIGDIEREMERLRQLHVSPFIVPGVLLGVSVVMGVVGAVCLAVGGATPFIAGLILVGSAAVLLIVSVVLFIAGSAQERRHAHRMEMLRQELELERAREQQPAALNLPTVSPRFVLAHF